MLKIKKIFILFLIASAVYILLLTREFQNKRSFKTRSKLSQNDLPLLLEKTLIKEDYPKQDERTKILISVNKGGPNNQISGLRDGLFLAQLLGREFVPPLFFRHFTTKGHFSMNPDVFIDLENLSSKFSTVNSSDVQSICGNAFDLILDADPPRTYETWTRLTYEYLNMDFSTYNRTEKISIEWPKNGTNFLKRDLEKYNETKCILLKHPYEFIPWTKIGVNKFKTILPFVDTDMELFKDVIR